MESNQKAYSTCFDSLNKEAFLSVLRILVNECVKSNAGSAEKQNGWGTPGRGKMSNELVFWQGGDCKPELASGWRDKWNKAVLGSAGPTYLLSVDFNFYL